MKEEDNSNISQEQVQDLLFNRKIGWRDILYDLINTEQLDPWNINIVVLSDGFLNKIKEYEEMDFLVSSKVLLAAALILRIKSELILSKYMKSIDEILFEKKEEKKNPFERMELDEEIPELIPRSPTPRVRKVTLNELIESLNKAINTENRRIKKVIINRNALRESGISLPKKENTLKERLDKIHSKIVLYFQENKNDLKVSYTKIVGKDKIKRTLSFFPILQLENNGKFWLEQKNPFEEIYIWFKNIFLKENPNLYDDLKNEDSNEEDSEENKLIKSSKKKFKDDNL